MSGGLLRLLTGRGWYLSAGVLRSMNVRKLSYGTWLEKEERWTR